MAEISKILFDHGSIRHKYIFRHDLAAHSLSFDDLTIDYLESSEDPSAEGLKLYILIQTGIEIEIKYQLIFNIKDN